MATPFDAELARLADLSDDELASLKDQITAEFEKADQAGDEAAMTALADALDQVLAEEQNRSGGGEEGGEEQPVAASAESDDEAEAPEAEVTETEAPEAEAEETTAEDESPAVEAVDETAEVKVEEETETPAAEADAPVDTPADADEQEGTAQVTEINEPQVPEDAKPLAAAAPVNTIVAGADIPGVPAGTQFTDRKSLNEAFASRVNTLRRLTGGDGEQVIIASIKADAGDDQTLFANDSDGNTAKIRSATNLNERALVAAAGDGWCAPLTTRYDIFQQAGVTDRPVRGSLTGFNADRGGIRYFPGFSLGDMAGAIGIWDSGNDPAADTKNIGTIACPAEQTCEIYAVTKAIKFSNVASRVFPELIDNANDLTMVAHARLAESTLLAAMKASATAVAGPTQTVGTVRQILHDVALVAAYYRDRHRLAPETPLRTMLPVWLLEAVRADITLDGPDKDLLQGLTEGEVRSFFSDRNINVTWVLDSPVPGTNGGGFYAADAVFSVPGTVEYPVFVEGSYLFLDGGTLDLGVVRDSTLVQKNEYIEFAETFEGLCHVGGESLWITSNVAVDGQFVAGTQWAGV